MARILLKEAVDSSAYFALMNKLLISVIASLTIASTAYSAQEGQPVPPCHAALADTGNNLDFNAYRGKVILVDFWATWCPPCKKSMPFLNSLRNQTLKDGFEIVAINVDENRAEAEAFLKEHPVDYPMAFDSAGDCPQQFDVKAMPSSYLLDKTGTIRKIHLGFRDEDQTLLSEQISQLLAE